MEEQWRPQQDTPASPEYVIKMVFLGQPGVGKTGIWMTYRDGKSLEEMGYTGTKNGDRSLPTTIGVEFAASRIKIGDHRVLLMLHDTAGQERYASISLSYVRGANGVVLVYDVTDRSSYDKVHYWYAHVQNRCIEGEEPLVLLIGNKCDLAEHHRAVPTEEARAKAELLHYFFFETSAFKNTNVQEAINHFAAACFSHRVLQAKNKAIARGASVSALSTEESLSGSSVRLPRDDSPSRWLDWDEDRRKMASMGAANYGSSSNNNRKMAIPALVIDGKTKNYRHYNNGYFRPRNGDVADEDGDYEDDTKYIKNCTC